MIKPTVGRIVWYRPALTPHGVPLGEDSAMLVDDFTQPLAAQIIHVNPDGRVNLDVTDHAGYHHFRVARLRQDDQTIPLPFCEWMPYQVGQAKKHNAESLAAQPAP